MTLCATSLALLALAQGPEAQRIIQAHSEAVTDLSFSRDGKTIATASMDLTVKIWDVKTGGLLGVLPAGERNPTNGAVHRQFYVAGLRFFPDSRRLATFGDTAKIWDVVDRRELLALITGDSASCLAITPDGNTVAKGGWGITLWDARTGMKRRQLEAEACPAIQDLSFSSDGRILLSSGWKNNEPVNHAHIMVWSLETGEALLDLGNGRTWVDQAALSADGKLVLATLRKRDNETSTLTAWELPSGMQKYSLGFDGYRIDQMVLSPDSRSLVTRAWGGSVRLWDLVDGQVRQVHLPALPNAISFAFSPDGKLLAIGESRRVDEVEVPYLSVRDPFTGRALASARVGRDSTTEHWSHLKGLTVSFSPDGRHAAMILGKGEIALLDVGEFLESR